MRQRSSPSPLRPVRADGLTDHRAAAEFLRQHMVADEDRAFHISVRSAEAWRDGRVIDVDGEPRARGLHQSVLGWVNSSPQPLMRDA